MNNNKSDAILVKEFTEATGFEIPKEPQVMSIDQVHFISKMIIDELKELLATVQEPEEYNKFLKDTVDSTKDVVRDFSKMTPEEIIAEQNDAFVDIYYYSLNCSAKHGVNLSTIFKLVHNANMSKRDPESGMFIKREDGKIVKPPQWRSPDIVGEIKRQKEYGAFK
jgi:predicted HAD superfamily Cof-like phosphohydrolase